MPRSILVLVGFLYYITSSYMYVYVVYIFTVPILSYFLLDIIKCRLYRLNARCLATDNYNYVVTKSQSTINSVPETQ